jgi:hypothetical protein
MDSQSVPTTSEVSGSVEPSRTPSAVERNWRDRCRSEILTDERFCKEVDELSRCTEEEPQGKAIFHTIKQCEHIVLKYVDKSAYKNPGPMAEIANQIKAVQDVLSEEKIKSRTLTDEYRQKAANLLGGNCSRSFT